MRKEIILRSILVGLLAMLVLLSIYFIILTLVSGWRFARFQFSDFWYFIISLALGFGIQVGLYTYFRQAIRQANNTGKVVAVSGTTSTIVMISCCSHYLVNILPIIGIAGLVTLMSQYQVELFWFGLLANFFGIFYLSNKIRNLSKGEEMGEKM